MSKDYSKIAKFEKESYTHKHMRAIAYKWLWHHGYRAFASFVEVEPYGIIDVVGFKENEITVIDIINTWKEMQDKSKDIAKLEEAKQELTAQIVKFTMNINYREDINNIPELKSGLKVLSDLNNLLEDGGKFWVMINSLNIANKHYCMFLNDSQPVTKINGWGYIKCNVSKKSLDYKTYVIQEADFKNISTDFIIENITNKMLRSASTEMFYNLPQNTIAS